MFLFSSRAPSCADKLCSEGEYCPFDAVSCADRRCYIPTCTDGCGEAPVPSGETDEACFGDTGCSGGECVCDGSGNCISSVVATPETPPGPPILPEPEPSTTCTESNGVCKLSCSSYEIHYPLGDEECSAICCVSSEPILISPDANFSASPIQGEVPLLVSFDASSSSDSDGSIVLYSWNFGDGTNGSGIIINHTYTQTSGSPYTATLTVHDNDNMNDSSTLVIYVIPAGLELPVSNFTASPSTGPPPLEVTFNASPSFDPDGSISDYSWNFGDGTNGSGVLTTHTYTTPNTDYTATLIVTDNDGLESFPHTMDISVTFAPGSSGQTYIPFRGVYNSAGIDDQNLAKIERQIQDGAQDILVKYLGFKSPPISGMLESLNVMNTKISEYGGDTLWPVFNFYSTSEKNWVNSDNLPYTPYTLPNGTELDDTPCITRDFWHALQTSRFVELAQLALTNYTTIEGGVIDMELYLSSINKYEEVCYCESCVQDFFDDQGIQDPVPPPQERFDYLNSRGLVQSYKDFRTDELTEIAQETYNQVKAVNPDFVIAAAHSFYPDYAEHVGITRGLGTPEDPYLEFTESFYATGYRPDSLYPWLEDLDQAGINAVPIIGFWDTRIHPSALGSHLHEAATNVTSGYWIYTGQHYEEDNPGLCYPFSQYRDAVALANSEIEFFEINPEYISPLNALPYQVTPPGCFEVEGFGGGDLWAPYEEGPMSSATPWIRRSSFYHFYAEQGETIDFEVTTAPMGSDPDTTIWWLTEPSGGMAVSGLINPGDVFSVNTVAEETGVYGLYISVGLGRQKLTSRSHPGGYITASDPGLFLFDPEDPLYVYVPSPTTEVEILLTPGEPNHVAIFDTRFPDPLFDQIITEPVTAILSIQPNPDGTVLEITFVPIAGSEDIQIDVLSGAYPFLSLETAGLFIGNLCGNGVVDTGEECDGSDYAGASCMDFGFDGGNLICNPAGSHNECTISSSQCGFCSLLNAYWGNSSGNQITTINEGEFAVLFVEGDRCGLNNWVSFDVREDDGGAGIPAQTQPISRPFVLQNLAVSPWIAEAGLPGDSQYYFNATLNGNPSETLLSPILTVLEP